MAQQTIGGQRSALAQGQILEDHLKKVLCRTGPKAFKTSDNQLLPKPQHSAFGDFPASHMPKKQTAVLQPQPLAAQEQSVANAVTMMSKFFTATIISPFYTKAFFPHQIFFTSSCLPNSCSITPPNKSLRERACVSPS